LPRDGAPPLTPSLASQETRNPPQASRRRDGFSFFAVSFVYVSFFSALNTANPTFKANVARRTKRRKRSKRSSNRKRARPRTGPSRQPSTRKKRKTTPRNATPTPPKRPRSQRPPLERNSKGSPRQKARTPFRSLPASRGKGAPPRRPRKEKSRPTPPTRRSPPNQVAAPKRPPERRTFRAALPLVSSIRSYRFLQRFYFNDLNAKTTFFLDVFRLLNVIISRRDVDFKRDVESFRNFLTKSQETSKRAARLLATERRVFAKPPKLTRFRRRRGRLSPNFQRSTQICRIRTAFPALRASFSAAIRQTTECRPRFKPSANATARG